MNALFWWVLDPQLLAQCQHGEGVRHNDEMWRPWTKASLGPLEAFSDHSLLSILSFHLLKVVKEESKCWVKLRQLWLCGMHINLYVTSAPPCWCF